MDALAVALIAVLGAMVGSFLNVVVYRVPRGESVVSPGSRCPECDAPIRPWDNVPVLSWLILRGRCRNCGTSISARYPLVEALTAVVFAAVALARGFDSRLVLELPFAAMLIAVAAIDLEHRIVPNRIVVPMAIYAIVGAAIVYPGELPELLAAGAGAFIALLLAALAKPAGMGMGDVKLAGVMGLYLGVSVIPALFAAFLTGAVVGITLAIRQGDGVRGKGIPFAPFLAVGGLVGLLAGPELVDLYLNQLG